MSGLSRVSNCDPNITAKALTVGLWIFVFLLFIRRLFFRTKTMAVFSPLQPVSRTSTAPLQNLVLNPQKLLLRTQLGFTSKFLSSSSNLFFTTLSKSKSQIQYLRRRDHSHYNPIQSLFTGIVEELGEIKQLGYVKNDSFEMKIAARIVLEDVKLGDSISVNGTCLTVTEFDKEASDFSVGLSPETLRKTSLIELATGSLVNLERALQPSTRMGGHFVQGHVDGTGEIVSFEPEGDSLWVKVKTPPELLKYIVPKGFIAVDGTSLTVVSVFDEEQCFNFMLVDYTQQNVIIPLKKVGQKVNLEVDILGKYVERLLKGGS